MGAVTGSLSRASNDCRKLALGRGTGPEDDELRPDFCQVHSSLCGVLFLWPEAPKGDEQVTEHSNQSAKVA